MTATRANVVLRHIRDFAAAESAGHLTDRDLLARFATTREEAAFEALVRRHGPLVLGVCRRVLHNRDDADDVFQATFLALARQAASAGRRASLGTWLYRVAYYTAIEARKRSDVRRRREERTPPRPQPDPLTEVTGRELLSVLDEELHRLPEQLRAPLVLCYLEGKTRDEAARELGWSLGTLKRRLEQARAALRTRVAGRGISLTALLAAGVGAAVVSPALAAATASRAAGAVPAITAAGRKLVAVLVLAAGIVAGGAGLLTQRTPRADAPAAEEARAARPDLADKPAPAAPPADEKKESIISGRVLDADGKRVAEADVALVGMPKSRHPFASGFLEEKVLAHGKADAEGRFRIALADVTRASYQDVYALVGKEGHGLGCEKVPAGAETVPRLTPEKIVKGRILDLQGLPAAGVEVRISWTGSIHHTKVGGIGIGPFPAGQFPRWPGPTTTDRDGKFVLRGLNPDFGGWVHVEGDAFAPQDAEIKPGAENRTQEMNLTVVPALVLEGVVTADDTGRPIAGALVSPRSAKDGRTDEQGRFRIKPSWAGAHRIAVTPADDQPYLPLETGVDWPKGAVRHEVKLALKRGVLVLGKVTDAATGKPIARAVIHDGSRLWLRHVESGPDGTFRIAMLPGRGNLLVQGPDNEYVALQLTSGELQGGKRAGYRVYPDALIPLDLKAGSDPVEVSTKLRRGVTVRGRLVGPDGKPVAEAVLLCWNQLRPYSASWFASAVGVRDGEFELRGCDPEETYPVHFLDAKNQWGASVKVSAKEAMGKPPTVRLERCGRAVLRFVNKDGKPVPGVSPYVNIIGRAGEKDIDADADFVANIDRLNYSGGGGHAADADGRCTFPALIPGVTYRLFGPGLKADKEFVVKAGETLALPDVVVEQ
jgi:RNA polymerase sigma factor (sigma-70 family)